MGNEASVEVPAPAGATAASSGALSPTPAPAAVAATLDMSFHTPRETKVTVCAIGVGSRLRSLLRRLLTEFGDAVDLVAMCDVEPATSKTREKLGALVERAAVFDLTRVEEMLAEHKPKWVMVGSQVRRLVVYI